MKICVFCASSNNVGEPYVSAVKELGREIGSRGHDLVFGGYDTGLMGAVSHAVKEAGGKVFGVIPEDVRGFSSRKVFNCDEVFEVPDISRRKDKMMNLSDAYISAPGGLGTMDELFEALVEQKLTSGKKKPIALYNVSGCYELIEKSILDMSSRQFVPQPDLDLFFTSSDAKEIVDNLERLVK